MDQLRQVMLRQEEKKEKLFSKHKDEKAELLAKQKKEEGDMLAKQKEKRDGCHEVQASRHETATKST